MKPILFNTDMVRAFLEGRKTCTRRVIKPKYRDGEYGFQVITRMDGSYVRVEIVDEYENEVRFLNEPYHPGDILYVRETWQRTTNGMYIYRADINNRGSSAYYNEYGKTDGGWRPSIHMPKKAARIFLRVTDVRVERLQDITDEQATAEGMRGFFLGMGESGYAVRADSKTFYDGPIGAFASLWNSTIKTNDRDTYGWYANPWVWVIEFERISKAEALGGGAE